MNLHLTKRQTVITVIVVSAFAVLMSLWLTTGGRVSYDLMNEKLHEIENKTETRITRSTRTALDPTQLPLACRLEQSIRSLSSNPKADYGAHGRWTETYEISAAGTSLRLSLLVVNNRVRLVILEGPSGSEALNTWETAVKAYFPNLPLKKQLSKSSSLSSNRPIFQYISIQPSAQALSRSSFH